MKKIIIIFLFSILFLPILNDEVQAEVVSSTRMEENDSVWLNGSVVNNLTGNRVTGCLVRIDGTSVMNTTDNNGWFSFPVSANRNYTLIFSKESFGNKTIGPLMIGNSAENISVRLSPKTANVHVVFKNAGMIQHVFEARIVIVNSTDESEFKATREQWPNELKCDVPAPGSYTITGVAPTFGEGTITEKIHVKPGDSVKVMLDVEELKSTIGRIRFRICCENSTPLENVSLDIEKLNVSSPFKLVRYTNHLGEYIFEGSPGTYNLTASRKGYVSQSNSFIISKRETSHLNLSLKENEYDDRENGFPVYIALFSGIIIILILISVTVVVFLIVHRKKANLDLDDEEELLCPGCGVKVNDDRSRCPDCDYSFPWKQFRCPECGKLLEYDSKKCNDCGNTTFELR